MQSRDDQAQHAEIERIKDQISHASNPEETKRAMLKLSAFPMTTSLLIQTKLPLFLKKHLAAETQDLKILGRKLRRKWKQIYREGVAATGEIKTNQKPSLSTQSSPLNNSIDSRAKAARRIHEAILRKGVRGAITLTFGDQAENHVGMQKIGQLAESGFKIEELEEAKQRFENQGCKCELIDLKELLEDNEKMKKEAEEAKILIIRDAVQALLTKDEDVRTGKQDEIPFATQLFMEQKQLTWDKHAWMKGRVVNKRARYNLCYAEAPQDPDYNAKKGRIVAYSTIPLTKQLRQALPQVLGGKAEGLTCEGNYYYNVSQCGIGFHGDSERRKVVAVRLGATIPLHYQWFYRSHAVGSRGIHQINHGDMYIMSEKAVGTDWKRKIIPTLRHAAGCKTFLTIKKK
eukprot:jgi/Bigna1/47591/estExt_Genewise1.C_160025